MEFLLQIEIEMGSKKDAQKILDLIVDDLRLAEKLKSWKGLKVKNEALLE